MVKRITSVTDAFNMEEEFVLSSKHAIADQVVLAAAAGIRSPLREVIQTRGAIISRLALQS
jgi:hypothetical protein